jgi:hypothetical protein
MDPPFVILSELKLNKAQTERFLKVRIDPARFTIRQEVIDSPRTSRISLIPTRQPTIDPITALGRGRTGRVRVLTRDPGEWAKPVPQ